MFRVALDRAVSVLAVAGCLCIFAIAGLIIADVVGRGQNLFSIPWKIDVTQYLLYLATFLAAPWALKEGSHVSVDLIVASMRPRFADMVSRLSSCLGSVICLGLVYFGYVAMDQSRNAGTLIFKSIIFPEWYTMIPVPVIFSLMALIFAEAAIRGAPDGRERNLRTGA